jgi:hypothetical protein
MPYSLSTNETDASKNKSKNPCDFLISKLTVKVFDKKDSFINILVDGIFNNYGL